MCRDGWDGAPNARGEWRDDRDVARYDGGMMPVMAAEMGGMMLEMSGMMLGMMQGMSAAAGDSGVGVTQPSRDNVYRPFVDLLSSNS